MRNAWTNHEVARLDRMWPNASRAELEAALPRHAWGSIKGTARRRGLVRLINENPQQRMLMICARHIPTFVFTGPSAG